MIATNVWHHEIMNTWFWLHVLLLHAGLWELLIFYISESGISWIRVDCVYLIGQQWPTIGIDLVKCLLPIRTYKLNIKMFACKLTDQPASHLEWPCVGNFQFYFVNHQLLFTTIKMYFHKSQITNRIVLSYR